jgi:hypothetical protein
MGSTFIDIKLLPEGYAGNDSASRRGDVAIADLSTLAH